MPCNSTESCYFPPYKCSKSKHSSKTETPRIKCVSCRIVIHLSCKDKLKEDQTMCRPTYKEPLGNQSMSTFKYQKNSNLILKSVTMATMITRDITGSCASGATGAASAARRSLNRRISLSAAPVVKRRIYFLFNKLLKLLLKSHEYRAITCSWCKDSYHFKEACFNSHDKLTEPCTMGEHRKLIVPPYWIIKTRSALFRLNRSIE